LLLLGVIFFSFRINYDLEEARCTADKGRKIKEEKGGEENGVCSFIANV
jgi:hypothetical protein